MLIPILLFLVGIALLVKGADYFVDGGGGLAARFGVSSTTIGFTVIAFGTSLPEFVVTTNAIVIGNSDIGLGNVVGSNIANIGLILALCAVIKPEIISLPDTRAVLTHETVLMLGATAVFVVLALRGVIDAVAGIVFLAVFMYILRLLWKSGRTEEEPIVPHGRLDYIYTAGGLVAVIVGSQLVLDAAVNLAELLGIPTFVIGLSMVAVGTSLPELATSIVAVLRGSGGISVGNILGSNIFNLLFVLGIGAIIRPVTIPGYVDSIVMVVFSLLTLPLFIAGDRLTRGLGFLMLIGYAGYMLFLFGLV